MTPMDQHESSMKPYRQLLDRLQDLAAAGVTEIPHCEIRPNGLIEDSAQSSTRESQTNTDVAARDSATASGSIMTPLSAQDISENTPSPSQTASIHGSTRPRRTTQSSTLPTPVRKESSPVDLSAATLASLDDLDDATRTNRLEILNESVRGCETCQELVQNRTQTVFGVGSIRPRLCFFGEAPGADEDRKGEPFVGKAGQLLNKIIAAMTLGREDVYILNAIKCRPPGNRNPTHDETECCRQYWVRQLEILRPEFICCLGGVAANTLFACNESVGKMRNRWLKYRGAQVMVTYHPAYLLRNEFAKRYVWADIQKLMDAMGLKRP